MKLTIAILISFFLFSCNSNTITTKYSSKEINIKLNKAEIALTSLVFDSLNYITLDDKNDISLLKDVNKIELCDSLMFLLDMENNKLFCFDIDGNFVTTIGKNGQGPGEYVKIFDFAIDHDKKQIIILDRSIRKILSYKLNGEYIESHTLNMMACKLEVCGNNYLFYTGGSDYYTKNKDKLGYNIFLTDRECNIIEKRLPYNPDYDNLINDKVFDYNLGDSTVCFHYAIYDTIYEFNCKNTPAKYVVDFNENKIPISEINSENFKDYINKSKYAMISNVCHSNDYMFVNYTLNNRVCFFIFNKKMNSVMNFSLMKNDIDKTSFALTYPLKLINNKAYFVKSAIDLLSDNKKDSIILNQNLITSDSNPIIIIGNLK